MDFDFRFRDASGKWKSVGHRSGADRLTALEGLGERTPGGLPPGRYMSRPRGRQRDWDLFSLDRDGEISLRIPSASERRTGPVEDQWLR